MTAVSSMKTRRRASSLDCLAFSSARAAATSGRSCSAACNVFFERNGVAFVEAPDRRRPDLQPLPGLQPRANLIERQVRLLGDQIEQPLPMPSSGDRLWPVPSNAATLPVVVQRSIQRIAVEAPRPSIRAASRLLSPSSISATARALRSVEYPFAIACSHRSCRRRQNLICEPVGIPSTIPIQIKRKPL